MPIKVNDQPIQITDEHGYITDRAVREAFDRIVDHHGKWTDRSIIAAEAFLRLVERYAARGVRLILELPPSGA